MTASQQLLAEYVENGSESAFRELVARYVGLVHSAAVRLTNGDAHLAEDITQTVFVDLARMAGSLSKHVMLGGWLHRHTCFVAAKALRSERRRQWRERQAAEMNTLQDRSTINLAQVGPLLDEAINQLGAVDRTAILLRFFEQRDFRSVGEALGSNEEAARKRVSRAVEKLHFLLKRRGVAFPVAALGTALASQAVAATPAGMAAGIAGTALASSVAGAGTGLTLLELMAVTKLKAGIIGAMVVASVATPLAIQHQTAAKLRQENQSLRLQLASWSPQQTQNDALPGQPAQAPAARPSSELLRLRGEVGSLRQQLAELQDPANLAARYRVVQSNAYHTKLQRGIEEGILLTEEERRVGFPRESWTFSGYATPKAATLSLMWALSEGNTRALLDSYTPEARQWNLENRWKGKSESEIAAEVKKTMGPVTRFNVLGQSFPVDTPEFDRVATSLTVEGEIEIGRSGPNYQSRRINYSMIKVGNEWKCCNQSSTRSLPGQP